MTADPETIRDAERFRYLASLGLMKLIDTLIVAPLDDGDAFRAYIDAMMRYDGVTL